ncbi:hypothetical protein H7H51_04615 [Mycolicibacterium farcinogenes]|nr:hypothetical protein [Mycolicibacterium farcinogenes]
MALRVLIYPLRPGDLTPPYWVAMSATAITLWSNRHAAPGIDAVPGAQL